MGVPRDSFDPLMYLDRTDDSVAGSYERPQPGGADSARPSVIQRAGDGTEQIRSAANTKHNAEVNSTPTSSADKRPKAVGGKGGVDNFGGLSASPSGDRSLKHGKWDHS